MGLHPGPLAASSILHNRPDAEQLAGAYRATRRLTEKLAAPLTSEDQVVQSMPDASPTKWHLAHTSWFFETFLLIPGLKGYKPFDPEFGYLFNSYYNAIGQRIARHHRGLLSRPSLEQVHQYRRHVDAHMANLFEQADGRTLSRLADTLTLGLNHEQQHQELILTDIKHLFAGNPLRPIYRPSASDASESHSTLRWLRFEPEACWIGHGGDAFAFDNESPRHRVLLAPFQLASRLTTNAEYLAFMDDGGYARPELWLSDGWSTVTSRGWSAPLYWEKRGTDWWTYSLAGMRPVCAAEPVCHISYYEADAFARWSGARMPTEFEWESVAANGRPSGNFLESERLHPACAMTTDGGVAQLFGDAWEWTASSYTPYPGYRPAGGALGEYNGKFMCNQMVLRGGSCATPANHIRSTYRNFFPPDARWQFSGIRLAMDA